MSNLVKTPYPVFTDIDGTPLDQGYIYIGELGLNPLNNPLNTYWDEALTIPARNLRTVNGYTSYNGSPGILYSSAAYSILVQNKRNETVYSSISPPTEVFDALTINGVVTIQGTTGDWIFDDDQLQNTQPNITYIWNTTLNGYMAIGTNGRPVDITEANILFNTDQSVTIPTSLTADTITATTIDAGLQTIGGETLRTKVIEIGTWNMKTTVSLNVAHGISDFTKVRCVTVMVQDDFVSELYPITYDNNIAQGGFRLSSTNVVLLSPANCYFDQVGTDYDGTSVNRGWITIVYET